MKQCKICGKDFTDLSIKVHVKKQHGLRYREYRLKFNEIEYQKCLYCNTILENSHHSVKYCNSICNEKYKEEEELRLNHEKYKDIDDIPTCVICGIKGLNLVSHINNKHKISVSEYKDKYNLSQSDIYHQSYLDKIGVTGERNGAYNHGGKYSPFSKKFIYYDEEKRQATIKKASKNREYNTRREYFLEDAQINYDLADWLLSERQTTFSLDICIEKYGKEKGMEVWKERQNKWLSNFKRLNYSLISQELFWNIYEKIQEKYSKIYFAQLGKNKELDKSGRNHEYKIDIDNSYCKADFFIKDINKIIEFDGDYWHGEARGNIERDKERDCKLNKSGYEILHIKERDYNSNPQKAIKKCMEFINGEKV